MRTAPRPLITTGARSTRAPIGSIKRGHSCIGKRLLETELISSPHVGNGVAIGNERKQSTRPN